MSNEFKKFIKIILFLIFIYRYLIYNFIRKKKPSFSLNKNKKNFNIIKNQIQASLKKNINYIDSLYIMGTYNFGNFIISINNAIIFCEFFHCKRIIIESYKKILIINKIFYQKYNLTIDHNSIITNNIFSNNLLVIQSSLKNINMKN